MVTNDSAIRVKNIYKSFRVHLERNATLKESVLYTGRAKYREFVALHDISLDITRGSTVGLIGVNGSGKSTLLKIMSRILNPDRGSIEVNGRVSSLLELGAGFHPDFNGLENIFLNGALMGLTKREIRNQLEEIVAFSELGDFIQEPIRSYSSGMYMRLAFSVAVAVNPEILLIDEILAVGDAAFQTKCLNRLKDLQTRGCTIVIVAHDTDIIERFCDSAVWLDNSRVQLQGSPSECVRNYLEHSFRNAQGGRRTMNFDHINELQQPPGEAKNSSMLDQSEGKFIQLSKIETASDAGPWLVWTSHTLRITIYFRCLSNLSSPPIFSVSFFDFDSKLLYATKSRNDKTGGNANYSAGDNGIAALVIKEFALASGTYRMAINALTESGEQLVFEDDCGNLVVLSDSKTGGIVEMSHEWSVSVQLLNSSALTL